MMRYNQKYAPGIKCKVIRNPSGVIPVIDIVGRNVTIQRVVRGKYILADGWKFEYVTASKFLRPIKSAREVF
jgi:hypothetical protein